MDRSCLMQRASAVLSHRIKKVGKYMKRENKIYWLHMSQAKV